MIDLNIISILSVCIWFLKSFYWENDDLQDSCWRLSTVLVQGVGSPLLPPAHGLHRGVLDSHPPSPSPELFALLEYTSPSLSNTLVFPFLPVLFSAIYKWDCLVLTLSSLYTCTFFFFFKF